MFTLFRYLFGGNGKYRIAVTEYDEAEQPSFEHSLLTVPSGVIGLWMLPFLKIKDVVRLDSAILNRAMKKHFFESLVGRNVHKPVGMEQFVWLTARRCFVDSFNLTHASYDTPVISTYLKSVKTITELTIGSSVRIAPQVLTTMINTTNRLEVLNIQASSIDWANWNIHTVLSLVVIDVMNSNTITDDFMITLLEHSPHLQVLKVSFNYRLSPSTLLAVANEGSQLCDLNVVNYASRMNSVRDLQYEAVMRQVLVKCTQLLTLHASIHTSEGIFPNDPGLRLNVRCVILHAHQVVPTEMDSAIVNMARCSPQLEKLTLSSFEQNTDVSMHAIAQHLLQLQSMEMLYWGNVTESGISAVRNACPKLAILQFLDCSGATGEILPQGPPGVLQSLLYSSVPVSNANFVFCAQHNYNLRILHIGFYDADAHTIELTAESVRLAVTFLHHLISFKFSVGNAQSTQGHKCIDDHVMYALVENCPLLEKLNVWKSVLVTSSGFHALSRLSHLRELNASYCPGVNNDVVCAIAEHCVWLEELWLQGCAKVTSAGVSALARHARQLRYVSVADCGWIRDAAVLELIQKVPNLQTVYVNSYFLTPAVITLRKKVKIHSVRFFKM